MYVYYNKSTPISKDLAILNNISSSNALQTSCTPNGNPSCDKPKGKLIAGKPK